MVRGGMSKRCVYACVTGLVSIGAFAMNASANTIYLQNFGATGGMTPTSGFGWSIYYGNATTDATVAPAGPSGSPANAQVSGGPSAPTPGANINAANGGSTQTAMGFVPMLSNNGAQQFVAYTSAYSIDRTKNALGSFSWYAGSYYAGDTQRLIIQIGGNWYASTNPISPVAFGSASGGQGFGPASQKYTTQFTTDAGDWQQLNFSTTTPLTLGNVLTAPLPDGTITAFGLYAVIHDDTDSNPDGTQVSSERTFFDTYEVDTVPEPAVGFAAASIVMIGARRRRRWRTRG